MAQKGAGWPATKASLTPISCWNGTA